MPSSNVIDMDEGCHIINALQEHALALHVMMLIQGLVDPSDPGSLEPSTSPGEVSGTCPSSSASKDSLRLAGMSASTFIEKLEHANAVASQLGEGVKEQLQPGSIRLGPQVAFVGDYS